MRAQQKRKDTKKLGLFQKPDALLRLEVERVISRFRGGIHRSMQKGSGIDIASFKPYEPSDPLGSIDAFVSARVSEHPELEPISRVYHPEKEIATIALMDIGISMNVPPRKKEYAAKLLWLFALSAFRFGDRFRIIPFEGSAVYDSLWIANEDAAAHYMEHIEMSPESCYRVSWAQDACSYLAQLLVRDAVVVIISDFCMAWDFPLASLKQLASHEQNVRLILLALDEWEGFTPHRYGITIYDPLMQNNEVMSMADMARRADAVRRHIAEIAGSVRSLGAPLISIPLLSNPLAAVVRAFLKMGWT